MQITDADREAAQRIYDGVGIFAEGGVKARDGHELVQAFAAHREAERDRIVAWLREDADLTEAEALKINKNTTGNPRKFAAEWAQMIAMKRGIATAIEKGQP